MLTHKKCELAREATGSFAPDNEIIAEYEAMPEEERDRIGKELSDMFNDDMSNTREVFYELSAKHFTSYPVLFCLFKDWQAKNKK